MANVGLFTEALPLPFNHLDDVAFNAAIHELSHGPLNFDLDRLKCLVFNPIERLALALDCLKVSNVDQNLNVQALLPLTSRYMVENEISDLIVRQRTVVIFHYCT